MISIFIKYYFLNIADKYDIANDYKMSLIFLIYN